MPAVSLSVCVLLYGDYPQLASRCLDSISSAEWFPDVRLVIGMNAVSNSTRELVYSRYGHHPTATIFDSEENLRKYPMMRHMLYDPDGAGSSDLVMWFDDDSYLQSGGRCQKREWLTDLQGLLQSADMLGYKYTLKWQGVQKQWVQQQPWYNPGVSLDTARITFITGGWWVAKSSMLAKADYPWQSLSHNGGDSMLGEMCRHAGFRQVEYRLGGVAVNACTQGVSGKATRRGISEAVVGKSAADMVSVATTPQQRGGTVRTITENGLMQ